MFPVYTVSSKGVWAYFTRCTGRKGEGRGRGGGRGLGILCLNWLAFSTRIPDSTLCTPNVFAALTLLWFDLSKSFKICLLAKWLSIFLNLLKHSIIFCYCTTTPFNTLAQLVEPRHVNPEVAGSSPALVNFSLFVQIYLKSVPSQFPLWFITWPFERIWKVEKLGCGIPLW